MEIIIKEKKKVVIAMSGGVDSSVAAHILKEEGYEVTGIMLKVWDDVSKCCSIKDILDAKRVAEQVGIPFKVIDVQKEFEKHVVNPFVKSYMEGKTPLPCALCNEHIKMPLLLKAASDIGFQYLATGHYVVRKELSDGSVSLFKGVDSNKDQTYFLFRLKQEHLQRLLFPIGDFVKSDIRDIAAKIGIDVAQKSESQEVCFVSDNYQEFLLKRVSKNEIKYGNFVSISGKILGKHNGIHSYTIGQRKGLGIALGKPAYVVAIDPMSGDVIIGDDLDLMKYEVTATNITWLNKTPKVGDEIEAKIRYRQKTDKAIIKHIDDNKITVIFKNEQRAVTPGQGLVLYSNDELLGGGFIM
ncbi:tRNA 2-thiouridine(34) synthase MnmA [bacterium]|nr:tRNA 2-thiouridine(34) synthase MnmA [bacterium]